MEAGADNHDHVDHDGGNHNAAVVPVTTIPCSPPSSSVWSPPCKHHRQTSIDTSTGSAFIDDDHKDGDYYGAGSLIDGKRSGDKSDIRGQVAGASANFKRQQPKLADYKLKQQQQQGKVIPQLQHPTEQIETRLKTYIPARTKAPPVARVGAAAESVNQLNELIPSAPSSPQLLRSKQAPTTNSNISARDRRINDTPTSIIKAEILAESQVAVVASAEKNRKCASSTPPSSSLTSSQPSSRHELVGDRFEEEQFNGFFSNSNNFLFWKLLSNLPKSITQRNIKAPTPASALAPEVLGYIKSKGKTIVSNPLAAHEITSVSPSPVIDLAAKAMTVARSSREFNDESAATAGAKSIEMSEVARQQGSGHRSIKVVEQKGGHSCEQQQLERWQVEQSAQISETAEGNIGHPNKHEQFKRNHQNESKPNNQQQIKLSITTTTTATTTTNTATTTRSSASSLDSCILSESTVSEVRLKWGKKMDFLLSIIGFAVDLANIWRFPYLVYKNGGGVFLIPYVTMLIFGGIPLFFLELCLGQYVKKGPITVWNKICPSMKGVGYCSILISWYVSFYYNVLIAWSVYFIYRSLLSFGHKMPWEDCDNSWNTKSTCVSISQLKFQCAFQNDTLENCRKIMFGSDLVSSPASEFFVKELSQIDQSTGLDDMGALRLELVICAMIVYLLHYFSLFRGLETSGKVVWVTATAPYMILSILLVRGLFLPGATMGIKYYLSPKLERLSDPQVWIDAAGQVFYSIGVGFGVHLTYASFNSHNNNCHRDCLTTSAVNALTSVYSGLVVFVYLGYMAQNLGIEIDKVASEGYSLVFEVYPEALTTLPFARFWSILFFIMLLTLGIDSAMGGLEAVITGLEDEFKFARRLSRAQLTGLVIVSSFLPALISCTQGGAYTLFWFDIYSAGVSLLFSALFETIGVVYCYGLDKFILNIESMLNRKPHMFYILCWKYISPLFLGVVIFMSIYTAGVPTYRGYTFPTWSIVLGWCLAFSSVAAVPIVAIWSRYTSYRKSLQVYNGKSSRRGKDRDGSAFGSEAKGKQGSGSRKLPNHKTLIVRCIDQAQGVTTRTTCTTNTTPLTTSTTTSSSQTNKDRNMIKTGEDML